MVDQVPQWSVEPKDYLLLYHYAMYNKYVFHKLSIKCIFWNVHHPDDENARDQELVESFIISNEEIWQQQEKERLAGSRKMANVNSG